MKRVHTGTSPIFELISMETLVQLQQRFPRLKRLKRHA